MGHQLIFHVLNLPIEPAHLKSLTVLGFSPNFKGGQVEINIGSVSLFLSTFLLSGINVLRLIFLGEMDCSSPATWRALRYIDRSAIRTHGEGSINRVFATNTSIIDSLP